MPIMHAAAYGEPLPVIDDGSRVYIVDFSYDRATLDALAKRTVLVVLDHHKSAQDALRGAPYALFGMKRSGAKLAWDWFHSFGEAVSPLVLYVQDRDLWNWALPQSKEINQFISSYPFSLSTWDRLNQMLQLQFGQCADAGAALLRYQRTQVDRTVVNAFQTRLGKTPATAQHIHAVNCSVAAFASDSGEQLCRKYESESFAAYYFDRPDVQGQIVRQWGLRSRNGFDVSEIAKQYGGGGHAAASGFVTDINFYGESWTQEKLSIISRQ